MSPAENKLISAKNLNSTNIDHLLGLANAAIQNTNFSEAVAHYRKVLLLEPNNADALHYYGVLLVDRKAIKLGIDWITKSLRLDSRDKLKFTNRAIALQRVGLTQQAKADLLKALSIDAECYLALLNLGHVYKSENRLESAIRVYQKVISIQPNDYPPYDHLTYCFSYPDNLKKRVESAQRAHYLNPLDHDCAYNFSLYCLMVGRFAEGWDLSRSRWLASATQDKTRYSDTPSLTRPVFDLASPKGPVFIWAEQGLGDEIMFLSILMDFLKQVPEQTIVQVDSRMLSMWRRSFPTVKFIKRGEIPEHSTYQSHLAAGDLPGLFRRSKNDFPSAEVRYLMADEFLRERLSKVVRCRQKPVVGLGWFSTNGSTRRIPLIDLVKVISKFDVTLVNLQYGDITQEVNEVEKELGTRVFMETGVNCDSDLEGLAALMKSCDLVISISNTTVHLAGALGVKTWGLLPFFPGWRWFSDGDTSLWYRSVSLIRQSSLSDWSTAYAELERRLQNEYPLSSRV